MFYIEVVANNRDGDFTLADSEVIIHGFRTSILTDKTFPAELEVEILFVVIAAGIGPAQIVPYEFVIFDNIVTGNNLLIGMFNKPFGKFVGVIANITELWTVDVNKQHNSFPGGLTVVYGVVNHNITAILTSRNDSVNAIVPVIIVTDMLLLGFGMNVGGAKTEVRMSNVATDAASGNYFTVSNASA